MDNQIVVFHYEPDGSDIYLPIGFVPDFVLISDIGNSAPKVHIWWEMQEDDEATGSQEGLSLIGSSSAFAKPADSQGIIAYDSGSQGPTVTVWSSGATWTARSATAHGSYVKPTVAQAAAQGVDREAIFEVVSNTTAGTTEPTWAKNIGGQCQDNHASPVVYERVNVPLTRIGYQGIVVANELQTNAEEMYGVAIQADKAIDFGDVDGWTGGVQGA